MMRRGGVARGGTRAGGLARTEARDADLAGDLLEGLVQRLLELLLVDLDGELDLVALEGLDDGFHKVGRVYRRVLRCRASNIGRLGSGLDGTTLRPNRRVGTVDASAIDAGRGVAQPGSAPALGAGGRGFKSRLPDHRLPSMPLRV